MRFKDLFEEWGLTGLNVNMGIVEAQWEPDDHDKNAAWELYVELVTRVTTQELDYNEGEELAALRSFYEVFMLTRDILKKYGRKGQQFSLISIFVLNHILRPFMTKWHPVLNEDSDIETKRKFREDMKRVQKQTRIYTRILARIADVEDMTEILEIPK